VTTSGDARTRLWLVRHGQIAANVEGRWHGWTDSPLTDTGRRQVERVADWFRAAAHPVRAIYTSPLQRTHDTARGIGQALGLEPEPVRDLREYGIGDLEDTPFRELVDRLGFFERIRKDRHWAPSGGESLHGVVTRMQATLIALADRHPGEDVVVVSHGAAMALAIAQFMDADAQAWGNYHVSNCSVSELWLHPEPALGLFDHKDHLEGAS
jgi:broad specificity phosphatase PhoE